MIGRLGIHLPQIAAPLGRGLLLLERVRVSRNRDLAFGAYCDVRVGRPAHALSPCGGARSAEAARYGPRHFLESKLGCRPGTKDCAT